MNDWTDKSTEIHLHRGAPEATDDGHCAPRLEQNTIAHNYDNEQRSASIIGRGGGVEVIKPVSKIVHLSTRLPVRQGHSA